MQNRNRFEEITPQEFEKLSSSVRSIPRMKKNEFVKEFKETILNWVKEKEGEIVRILREGKYSWYCKNYEDPVRERDQLELAIKESRKQNEGGIDLETADRVCRWGFNRKFPLRDPQETIKTTKEAFEYVEKENYFEAAKTLMNVSGVGISRASKIIGLSDQNRLCIYDSRVGNALRELKKENVKLVLCPPDRSYRRDFNYTTKSGWATNYERLIWAIQIMQEYFKIKSRPLRAADIEMALFVMGE